LIGIFDGRTVPKGLQQDFPLVISSMKPLEVKLTGNGMANIPKSKSKNDFEFIVGNNRYGCPWFVADFISPMVGQLHSSDPSVDEFHIDIGDAEEHFENFLTLGFGSTLDVSESDFSKYRRICCALGNREVYDMLIDRFEVAVTISNVFSHIHDCDFFNLSRQPLIEFVASHFFELPTSASFDLPIQTFIEILSHPSLQLATEDSLYDIIASRFETDADYFALVEYIRFEYFSVDRISALILWISNHFNQFNFGIWTHLSNRLKYQLQGVSPNPRVRCEGVLHELKRDTPLVGIIASLTHRYSSNVHDRGIVAVSGTVNSDSASYAAKNAADLNTNSYFHSKGEANQWICYDFKNRRVRPTHYSINSWGDYFLRSWVVEGSSDNAKWTELDGHEADPEMCANHRIGTFAIPIFPDVDYQFIRLRQTGKNADGHDYLIITGFELFGYLID
jgi:hypothetical protein